MSEPSAITVAGNAQPQSRVIDFPVTEVKRLAGIDVSLADISQILGDLGFAVAGTGPSLHVTVPSWRPDVEGKADLVEEVKETCNIGVLDGGWDVLAPEDTTLVTDTSAQHRAGLGAVAVESGD